MQKLNGKEFFQLYQRLKNEKIYFFGYKKKFNNEKGIKEKVNLLNDISGLES